MLLGFFFSVIVSVLFAAYAIPRKFSNQNVILYTMFMGLSYFVLTALTAAVLWGANIEAKENLTSPWHLLTVLRGGVWVVGMALYNKAIDKIGLTRFNQWKNVQGPIGSILILFIVSENVSGLKTLFLFLGMTVMFLSATVFQIPTGEKSRSRSGVVCAVLSGVCFGVAALLNSVVSSQRITGERFIFSQLLYHSASLVIISAFAFIAFGRKFNGDESVKSRLRELVTVDKKTLLPCAAGAMYALAAVLTVYSYRLIQDSAVPWSITQANALWTILIGAFVFKEVEFKKHALRLVLGTLLAVGACVLLFFAM